MSGPRAGDALNAAKVALRRQLIPRRRQVPEARAAAAAAAAAERLLAEAAFASAPRVGLYAALPDELPTFPLFEALRARGVAALLPRVSETGALCFCRVSDWDELRPGRYRVLEPPDPAPVEALGPGDAVVVPGVAFDRSGRRLGRGQGTYDRAFPPGAGDAPRLFGYAYAFQLVQEVPADSRDRAMDAIVSERFLIWTDRRKP